MSKEIIETAPAPQPQQSRYSDGGPAFPCKTLADSRDTVETDFCGMTLRDWFAGQALAGIAQAITFARVNSLQVPDDHYAQKWAFGLADAMLEAREVLP